MKGKLFVVGFTGHGSNDVDRGNSVWDNLHILIIMENDLTSLTRIQDQGMMYFTL